MKSENTKRERACCKQNLTSNKIQGINSCVRDPLVNVDESYDKFKGSLLRA